MLKQYRTAAIIGKRERLLPNRLLNWSEILGSWIILLLSGTALLLGLNPWYVWGAWLFALVDILSALFRLQATQRLTGFHCSSLL